MSLSFTVVSPPEKEKRKHVGDDEDDTPFTERRQPSIDLMTRYTIKQKVLVGEGQPINLSSSHPEMFLESLQGNIEIIWCDDGIKEGFVDTFNKAYFNVDNTMPDAVKKARELREKTGIFVSCSRRISRESNNPVMKAGNNGGSYKSIYFIRLASQNDKDVEREQRLCLETIANVSNTMVG